MNSATRAVHVVDLLSPTIVALATADGQVNPVNMRVGNTLDPVVTTLAGYSITDNLDPSPTVSISGTVDANTVGRYNVVVTAQDNQTPPNEATYTRVLNVNPNLPSDLYGYHASSPLFTGTPIHLSQNVASGAYSYNQTLTISRVFQGTAPAWGDYSLGAYSSVPANTEHFVIFDMTSSFTNAVRQFKISGQRYGGPPIKLWESTSSSGPWTELTSFTGGGSSASGAVLGSSTLTNNTTVFRYSKINMHNTGSSSISSDTVLNPFTLLGN